MFTAPLILSTHDVVIVHDLMMGPSVWSQSFVAKMLVMFVRVSSCNLWFDHMQAYNYSFTSVGMV